MGLKLQLKAFITSFLLFFIYSFIFFRSPFVSVILAGLISIKFKEFFSDLFRKKDQAKSQVKFRDFLDILNSSVISGLNFFQAIKATSQDLEDYYSATDEIVVLVKKIYLDIENGHSEAEALNNFSESYDLEEAKIFCQSLIIALEAGMDINQVISNSKTSLNEQISIELEIGASINNGKREFLIMISLPLIILILLTRTDLRSLNFIDYLLRSVVYAVIVFAIYLGQKIVNLEL